MEWQVMLALVIVIPIILIPVAFVWYLNVGGIFAAIKAVLARRIAHRSESGELAKTEQHVAVAVEEQSVVK